MKDIVVFLGLKGFTKKVPENPISGAPKNPISAVPKNPISAVPENPISAVPENPISGVPENPISGVPENPISAVPENPISGAPENPISAVPENPISAQRKCFLDLMLLICSYRYSPTRNLQYNTVVGDYINTRKATLDVNFGLYQAFKQHGFTNMETKRSGQLKSFSFITRKLVITIKT